MFSYFSSFIHSIQTKLTETQASMSKISDQNILLRAQLTAAASGSGQQNGLPEQQSSLNQQQKITELEHQIASMMNQKSHQDTRIAFYETENARLLSEIEQFKTNNENVDEMSSVKAEYEAKIEKMNKDQEDLLELLADQDVKLKEYRKRLKNLGQPVVSDGDDEDED